MNNNLVLIDHLCDHLTDDDSAVVAVVDEKTLLITLLFYNKAHSFVFVVDLFNRKKN